MDCMLLISALTVGYLCDDSLNRQLHSPRYPYTALITALYAGILIVALPDWIAIMKGIIFVQLLAAAGYCDAKTHRIPNEICAAIMLDGLIQPNLISSVIGLFTVSLPLYLIALVFKNSVGGGDIKLMAACGFLMGPSGILAGMVVSSILFLLSVMVQWILQKPIKKKYAMAPYFGIGCCLAYLMKG